MREGITLACTECKRRNYRTNKNKKTTTERVELMKYCKWCHKHTLHKETKYFFLIELGCKHGQGEA